MRSEYVATQFCLDDMDKKNYISCVWVSKTNPKTKVKETQHGRKSLTLSVFLDSYETELIAIIGVYFAV